LYATAVQHQQRHEHCHLCAVLKAAQGSQTTASVTKSGRAGSPTGQLIVAAVENQQRHTYSDLHGNNDTTQMFGTCNKLLM
jgi:hypothetical protein